MAVFLSRLFVALHSRIHVVVRLHASTLWSHWWTSLVGWGLCQQPPRYCTTSIVSYTEQHTQYCLLTIPLPTKSSEVGPTEMNKSINSLQCVLLLVIMEIREANQDFVLKKTYIPEIDGSCTVSKGISFCVNLEVWILHFLILIFFLISVLVGTLGERYCQLVGYS